MLTNTYIQTDMLEQTTGGPSCSKLTMSLVNDSLKFTLSDAKLLTFFRKKYQNIVY